MILLRLITLVFASSLVLGVEQGTSEPDTQDPFGYLIVYPKILFAGTQESICATIKDADETVEVTLSFMEDNVTVISSAPPFNVEFDTACVAVEVPILDDYPKTIYLKANMKRLSMTNTELAADKRVVIITSSRGSKTFVQTDKPIYKPGQTVMFRVLTLDKDLKPDTKTVLDIWVETPSDIRVAQWLSQTSEDGLIDLKLPMSSDPPLGEWKIVVVGGNEKIEKTFKVDEYVLPKFEVLVTYPPFVLVNEKEFEIRICGRYTYGQPVRGSFSADINLDQHTDFRYWYRDGSPGPGLRFESADTGESGCGTVVISGEALQLNISNYSIWSSRLKVDTNFTEAATGVTLSNTDVSKKGIVTTDPLQLTFNAPAKFKPGMPFNAVLTVSYPDGLPAAGKEVAVTVRARTGSERMIILNRTFTSSDEGEINIMLDDVDFETSSLDLFAEANGYKTWLPYDSGDDQYNFYYIYDPVASHYAEANYSPSGSFARVAPIDFQLTPGAQQEITTHFTADPDVVEDLKWFFVFMSKSEIMTVPVTSVEEPSLRKKRTSEPIFYSSEFDTEEVNVTEPGQLFSRKDKFTVTSKMSPITRMLVYYILPDKEVVADSIQFDVKQIFDNQVSIAFATAEEAPGGKALLKLSATGGSLCAIGVVDKSIYILEEDKDQISKDNIFNKIREDDEYYNRYWVPSQSDHCPNEYPWWWHTALDRKRRKRSAVPYRGGSNYEDSSQAFNNMGLVFLSNLRVETRPCNSGRYPIAVAYESSGLEPQGGTVPLLAESVRSFFPETWLWQLERIGDSGEGELEVEVPHTITEWVGNGFCLSPETGLGVSDTTNLQAFQPFFVSLTLPYSIIRGEEIPIKATIFNYLRDECVVVRVSLIESDEFEIVGNTFTYKECVCAQTSKTVEFSVKALALGEIDIEVHAVSVSDDELLCGNEVSLYNQMGQSDAVRRKLLVEPEGIQHEESINRYFCPSEFPIGSFIERFAQAAPPNIVEGSMRGKFSLTGDLMGQTISNLDRLLRVPTGCGEQNMLGFVPNIVVMKYFTESGTLTNDVKITAENNMKRGYMRELNYRHKDGSYSAFGESDESGSTWLTAYVVRSFAQAAEFINIDKKDLDVSLDWLKERQNRRGCFNAVGNLCHKAMAGGVNNEITLTAYIVTTMLEAGVPPEDPVIQKAMTCLESESQSLSDNYAAAQLAYAMVLVGHPDTADVMQYLESRAVNEGETKHWISNRNDSSEYGSYYRSPRLSQEIEMTAYVLLAYTEYLSPAEARLEGSPVSRWLVGQRTSNGGFSSTQDTVIGLQALAAYAGILNNQPLKMSVDLMENSRKIRQFELLERNKLVMQEMELNMPSAYMVRARGRGCGLLQLTTIYNTLPLTPPVAPFTLTKRSMNLDHECKSYVINLCASYTGTGGSNMLLTEVKLTTGFTPCKASLDMLRERTAESKLKRVESDGKIINFYLDQGVDETPVCWEFIANKEFDVKDAKPGTLNLYDYYEKDLAISDSLEFTCDPIEEPEPDIEIPNIREEPVAVQELDEKPGKPLQPEVDPSAKPKKPAPVVDPSTKPQKPIKPVADPSAKPQKPPVNPVVDPSAKPQKPTVNPVVDPSAKPQKPTVNPVVDPSAKPQKPTVNPVVDPSAKPQKPTVNPVVDPSAKPQKPPVNPAVDPSAKPQKPPVNPAVDPSAKPQKPPVNSAVDPSAKPQKPAVNPAVDPSAKPQKPAVSPAVDPSAKPQKPAVNPAVDPSTKPDKPSVVEVEPTAKPDKPSVVEVDPTSKPDKPSVVEVEPTAKPDKPSVVEVEPTAKPDKPSVVEVEPTSKPDKPSVVEVEPTAKPDKPSVVEVEPTAKPDKPSVVEVEPTAKPDKPSVVEVQPTAKPDKPSVVEVDPTSKPDKPSVVEVKPTAKPDKPSVVEVEPTSKPDKPSVVEVEPTAKPDKPSVVEVEPTAKPDKPSVVEVEPTAKPELPPVVDIESTARPEQEITTTPQPASTTQTQTQTQTPTTTVIIADPYCLLDPDVCGDNGLCMDDSSQVLLYRCECDTGYEEIGGICVDVDECALQDSCPDPNTVCRNLPGTYDCLCQDGFQEDSEGNCIGCPICSSTLPDGFEEKYCAADYVYGTKLRPDKTLRVLVELRQAESKVRETRYIDPVVDSLCTCHELTYGDRILIITTSEKVSINRMRQKTIETADLAGAYIVPLAKFTKDQLNDARTTCQ